MMNSQLPVSAIISKDKNMKTPGVSHLQQDMESSYSYKIKYFPWLLLKKRYPSEVICTCFSLMSLQPIICTILLKKTLIISFSNTLMQKTLWHAILDFNNKNHLVNFNFINFANWLQAWNTLRWKGYNDFISWDHIIPQCMWSSWLKRNENLFNKKGDHWPPHYHQFCHKIWTPCWYSWPTQETTLLHLSKVEAFPEGSIQLVYWCATNNRLNPINECPTLHLLY